MAYYSKKALKNKIECTYPGSAVSFEIANKNGTDKFLVAVHLGITSEVDGIVRSIAPTFCPEILVSAQEAYDAADDALIFDEGIEEYVINLEEAKRDARDLLRQIEMPTLRLAIRNRKAITEGIVNIPIGDSEYVAVIVGEVVIPHDDVIATFIMKENYLKEKGFTAEEVFAEVIADNKDRGRLFNLREIVEKGGFPWDEEDERPGIYFASSGGPNGASVMLNGPFLESIYEEHGEYYIFPADIEVIMLSWEEGIFEMPEEEIIAGAKRATAVIPDKYFLGAKPVKYTEWIKTLPEMFK